MARLRQMPKTAPPLYQLPDDIAEDDQILLHNVLTAMRACEACSSYRVDVVPTGFLVRGLLSDDNFEIDSDDIFMVGEVCALRIERLAVARSAGRNELVVKVLNCKQRVMIAGSATFTACKKRKLIHKLGGSE